MNYLVKPLGRKAYGHIGHLPGSRMGPGDHHLHPGQARIATERVRDKRDRVIVQEKLDGSCVSVAKIEGAIVPLIRAGYAAATSHYAQHHMFAAWAFERQDRFDRLLRDGERVVGEWLAQAHGTRYDVGDEDVFVAFDLMTEDRRLCHAAATDRIAHLGFRFPAVLNWGPTSIEDAMARLDTYGSHGALDPVEGAVWRVERDDRVDFLGKYVRPDKVDGSYFENETWNWRPRAVAA